jgi:hypothetical protein
MIGVQVDMIIGKVVSRIRLALSPERCDDPDPLTSRGRRLGERRQPEQRPRTLVAMVLRHHNVIEVGDYQEIIS